MQCDGGRSMAAVLGNDNLLYQILIHMDYPTSLICCALVSKQWLRHASDPDFLCVFPGRDLLGNYSLLVLQRLRQRCVVDEDTPHLACFTPAASSFDVW